jgi:uncharacterized protein (DUF2147 family)
MRNTSRWIATAALTAFVATVAWAAGDVNGKWSFKQRGRQQGAEQTMILELKADGEKLTGSVAREGGEMKTDIKEGTIKGDEISFAVVREFNGQERKTQYKGKIDGDAIKGNVITNRQGQEQSREWVANRAK